MNEMLQAIVYDAVGTLIHVEPSAAAIYAQVGQRFGSRLDVDEIRRRFHAAFVQQDQLDALAGWRTDEARELRRWRDIVTQVLDDVVDPAGCFAALYETFSKPAAWASDPDAADVLAHFQQHGIRQALASNFDRRLHAVLEPMPIARHLEHLVISSEIGWRKPASEFFVHITETMQLPASEILFVGDDRTNDFEPARRAGMRALLVDPRGQHLDLGTERIGRLADLLRCM